MIAAAGQRAYAQGRFASWEMEADADLCLEAVAVSRSPKRRAAAARRS
jgi:hypothetical protein